MDYKMTGETRKIFIKNHVVSCMVGVHDFEKKGPQRVVINAEVYVEKQGEINDRLENVLNYDKVKRIIDDLAAGKHTNLLETMCENIVAEIMNMKGVLGTRVMAEKPDIYDNCESVGVEITRMKVFH